MVRDFIFELGCEELPSASVSTLSKALEQELVALLDKVKLSYAAIKSFATPRRIAVLIIDLQSAQASQVIVKRGPALNAAYDSQAKPSQALLGFAKSCGAELSDLRTLSTEKGEWIVYESETPGLDAEILIPELMRQALSKLPLTKPMRWGEGNFEFARPVQWVLMMLGEQAVAADFFGIRSGNQSRGHRFHHPKPLTILNPKTYEKQLKEAFVIADFATRREEIRQQVEALALTKKATAILPEALLDEVTSIVEWPCAMLGNFNTSFLDVPAEALIASMQVHQKCFALKDSAEKLLPCFIAVANIVSQYPEQVIKGNEKVMHARLSDAAFFFNQDKKSPLSSHIPATKRVVFQLKLGSLEAKSLRLQEFMHYFSQALSLDIHDAKRAAELSKCDLMTGMVGEFPELQGLMGYYYALHDGENRSVAEALNEYYLPRFAADDLPQAPLSKALALADRLDTLVGIFAIGQRPTGIKDPFKLRRQALAIARLLISLPLPLTLSELIRHSLKIYSPLFDYDAALVAEIKEFILERLPSFYQNQGIDADLVLAVRAKQEENLYDFDKRIQALKHFIHYPEAKSLAAACKRVSNILNQSTPDEIVTSVDELLLKEAYEIKLYQQIQLIAETTRPFYESSDYGSILKELATLKPDMDNFFDTVMVMVDEESLRKNRLSLMLSLKNTLQGVVDISKVQS